MRERLGEKAVVIGGSIAGLMTARVLADYFEHVVVLERNLRSCYGRVVAKLRP